MDIVETEVVRYWMDKAEEIGTLPDELKSAEARKKYIEDCISKNN